MKKEKSKSMRPMSQEQLLRLDNVYSEHDSRPFGKVTASARSFWIDGGHAAKIVESSLAKGAFELASDGLVNFGLPVREINRGETVKSKGRSGKFRALDAHVPKGFPIAYHPKIVAPTKRQVGRAAGGGKVLLAEDPHVTIIGDDNREFVYPDAYPYSAVCKLHIESRLRPGDPWCSRSRAFANLSAAFANFHF